MLSNRCDLSLNCVIRSSSPIGVIVLSSHWSSACSGTCDCTNRTARSGSMPEASRPIAMSRVRWASVRAVVLAGDRMQVHDAVDAVVALLQGRPSSAPRQASCRCAARRTAGFPRICVASGQLTRFHGGPQDSVCLGLTASGPDRGRAGGRLPRGGRAAGRPRRLDPQGQPGLRHRGGPYRGADGGGHAAGGGAGQPDRGRGAEPRGRDRRAGLDRGPARRHHQLPARFSGVCGVDRRRGGRRAQAGVVVHVPRGEMYAASRGGGAWQGTAGWRSRPSPTRSSR